MTKLDSLYKQITKEQKRIKMLENSLNGGAHVEYVDFVNGEIKKAKCKIADLQNKFDKEYEYQNS